MLNCKIDYKCSLCGHDRFYTIPADEKTLSNDFISSNNVFVIECKECRQKYYLKVTIGRI